MIWPAVRTIELCSFRARRGIFGAGEKTVGRKVACDCGAQARCFAMGEPLASHELEEFSCIIYILGKDGNFLGDSATWVDSINFIGHGIAHTSVLKVCCLATRNCGATAFVYLSCYLSSK